MDILKDIEKNILNINIYDKNTYSKNKDVLNNSNMLKLDVIKKQIDDYFKYKVDETNIITQKKLKYEEKYKSARELNDYNYTAYLNKKNELYNIFKETKTLDTLYEYLKYKNTDYKNIPDIYTYEQINLIEKVVDSSNNNVCLLGKILNPITKKCVKDPTKVDKPKVDKPKVDKPKADKPKVDKPKADKPTVDKPKADKPKADKPKADKAKVDKAKVDKDNVKEKECPEGKILNKKTNRCIKDVNYKPK
jgi:hypothetical protein